MDDIPARNQSETQVITQRVLPGHHDDFNSIQSSNSEERNNDSDGPEFDVPELFNLTNPVHILQEGDSNNSIIDNVEVASLVSRKRSFVSNLTNIDSKFIKYLFVCF